MNRSAFNRPNHDAALAQDWLQLATSLVELTHACDTAVKIETNPAPLCPPRCALSVSYGRTVERWKRSTDLGICPLHVHFRQRCDPLSQALEDACLDAPAVVGDGVGNLVMKHHHRIPRDEAIGIAALELEGKLPTQQELRIAHRVAHLDIVLERHRGDRVGVRLALVLEGTERP